MAIVATSNTLPDALGEGRFAAQDFLREIQAMAERFEVLRIDGEDYRRRDGVTEISALPEAEVSESAASMDGATLDGFDTLLGHLIRVHPSRYGALIDDVSAAHVTGMHGLTHHHDALRFVVLVDRLYDREVPMLVSLADAAAAPGVLAELFSEELLRSGYRKKYLRALSRLASLTTDGGALLHSGTAGAAS